MNYADHFHGKKITVMGLGLLGRGVGDIKFLAECGAKLIVTDLKTEEQLADSLAQLKDFKNIAYRLGGHNLEDFKNRDFILKAAGVPLDSPYIAEAKKNNIPVEMSTALFARLSGAMIVGVTGTRGKSTTTHLIHHILETNKEWLGERRVWLGGNVRGLSTLALLPEVKPGDIAVLELDSWQLQGFGEAKLSPHVAVFTNLLPDHLNYYGGTPPNHRTGMEKYFADKANIFKFQTETDFLICGTEIAPQIETRGKKIVADELPSGWEIKLPGEHNRRNAALALEACRVMGLSDEAIRSALATFSGVAGRLEFLREVRGVKIYNDTTATTPDATLAALHALGKNIVLIMGGADKNLEMSKLLAEMPEYCKGVILLPGTGTDKLPPLAGALKVSNLTEAVDQAMSVAQAGDSVVLSPAFASFGLFKNEFDRGDQFVELVKKLG